MTATFIEQITDAMITDALTTARETGCIVEWTGTMPTDCERWDDLARSRLAGLTVAGVRKMLDFHDIAGDDAADELRMGISIAAEPDGLPENALVSLY